MTKENKAYNNEKKIDVTYNIQKHNRNNTFYKEGRKKLYELYQCKSTYN